jgi:hypothetical protein
MEIIVPIMFFSKWTSTSIDGDCNQIQARPNHVFFIYKYPSRKQNTGHTICCHADSTRWAPSISSCLLGSIVDLQHSFFENSEKSWCSRNLVRKLTGINWGASTLKLYDCFTRLLHWQTASLTLVYSTAEYCAPIYGWIVCTEDTKSIYSWTTQCG